MGQVHRATDTKLKRQVTIKILAAIDFDEAVRDPGGRRDSGHNTIEAIPFTRVTPATRL